jgi:flagellin
MPSIVNTNMLALTTQRQMNKAQAAQQTAMTRLSSGLRINGAKDDAAGMSIANRMSSQITGLNQAVRNANDGISLAQTAEGGLSEINNNLQRMRELAAQAANSTNTASDRAALQQETKQLLEEIQRVSTTSDFNGIKLLDGSFQNRSFQIGAAAGQTTSISISSAQIKDLGSAANASITARGASSTTADVDGSAIKNGDIIVNGVSVGASLATDDVTSFSLASSSALAKAAAFNKVSGQTGVTATANANEVQGAGMDITQTGSGKIIINGVATDTINLSGGSINGIGNRTTVVQAINAMAGRTGVTAVDTGADNTGVKLVAADGRNISIGVTDASLNSSTTGLSIGTEPPTIAEDAASNDAGYKVFMGTYTLSSAKEMSVVQGNSGDITRAGLTEGTYSTQKAQVSTRQLGDGSVTTRTAFTAGDFKINGVLIGQSLAEDDRYTLPGTAEPGKSAIAKASAINKLTSMTGVTATVNTTVVNGSAQDDSNANATGKIKINGMETAEFTTTANASEADKAASRKVVVDAINAISGRTGVIATDTNDSTKGIVLKAADGRNVTVDFSVGSHTSKDTGLNVAADGGEASFSGSVSLSSAQAFTVERGTTTNDTNDTLGLAVGTYGAGRTGQSLNSIDISTIEGASKAIEAIDNAISSIDESRSNMGAYQNRFTTTVSALQTSSTNLSAARSRIQDADFAAESAEMSKANILQQAGTAMLAQANASSQGVLSLLR